MAFAGFRCISCGSEVRASLVQRCGACGGILEAMYSEGFAVRRREWDDAPTMWRYRSSFPDPGDAVTLGEGRTPMVDAPELAAELGVDRLYLKLELVNPTGSFKDRGLSVVASYARAHCAPGLVGASSGNALHAQAAYAARAGLPSLVLVPESVAAARLVQPLSCGTDVVRVKGNYSCCHRLAREIASLSGWYNASTTYENPVAVEGYKTVAYEILEDLDGRVDWVVIPVGAGPLLGAMGRGFAEASEDEADLPVPALLGVQAERCSPILRAFARDEARVRPWEGDCTTVAKGIGDPLLGYEDDGTYTLGWIRRTGGAMVGVTETAIREAAEDLARICGLHVDPAAAAALAGVRSARATGALHRKTTGVVLITGTGFKEVPAWFEEADLGEAFDPEREAIERLVPRRG